MGISILIRDSTKAVVSLNANDVLLNLISLYFLSDFLIPSVRRVEGSAGQ